MLIIIVFNNISGYQKLTWSQSTAIWTCWAAI